MFKLDNYKTFTYKIVNLFLILKRTELSVRPTNLMSSLNLDLFTRLPLRPQLTWECM